MRDVLEAFFASFSLTLGVVSHVVVYALVV